MLERSGRLASGMSARRAAAWIPLRSRWPEGLAVAEEASEIQIARNATDGASGGSSIFLDRSTLGNLLCGMIVQVVWESGPPVRVQAAVYHVQ
jgi:hypothetical protein